MDYPGVKYYQSKIERPIDPPEGDLDWDEIDCLAEARLEREGIDPMDWRNPRSQIEANRLIADLMVVQEEFGGFSSAQKVIAARMERIHELEKRSIAEDIAEGW